MKTIEERAKAFCENNICAYCRDRANCELRECLGTCILIHDAIEWLTQFGKSEHTWLTRWHDPKEELPSPGRPVIICTSPKIYFLASYDVEFGNWFTGDYVLDRFEIIGWREIHE